MTGETTACSTADSSLADLHVCTSRVFDNMTRKYALVRHKEPRPGGGFMDAFRMAIVELSSFGEQHFDLAGYPYESPEDALSADWAVLGNDFARVMDRAGPTDVEQVQYESTKSKPSTERSRYSAEKRRA